MLSVPDCIVALKSCLLIPLVGLLGALLCLTPSGLYLEEEYGLEWLFKLRGEISPSDKIVIIAIDRTSVDILKLPDDPERWPRSYYAQLIEKINWLKPAVIGINLTFHEARDPVTDRMLVEAMQNSRNTVLSNYLKQKALSSTGSFSAFVSERVIDPLPMFEQSALAVAPFPLPKTPAVKQFWTSKKSAGDIATFPGIIFHCYVMKHAFAELGLMLEYLNNQWPHAHLPAHVPMLPGTEVTNFVKLLQRTFSDYPEYKNIVHDFLLQANFNPQKLELLQTWLKIITIQDSLYLNHYGKAGSITTLPFYQALEGNFLNPNLFNNKVVLIGFADDIEPERNRGLYTVFSDEIGEVISPVEVAATAIANMIDNQWINSLSLWQQFCLLLAWGMLLSMLALFLTYRTALISILSADLLYFMVASYVFQQFEIWVPLITPLIIQTFLVLAAATFHTTYKRRKEHQKMQNAFSFYLPTDVVQSVVNHHDLLTMEHYGEVTRGLCMATDAGRYTSLSETMPPQQLSELMNAYYTQMFSAVKQHNGFVSDIIGDAMMAIWAKQDNSLQIRRNACMAALDIRQATENFNNSQPHQLPTRISLHYGEMRIGNVGAVDHYEYRAMGDTVNTASRIEGVNKLLKTDVLVSAEVIRELQEFYVRDLGQFILKGKRRPVHIYELVDYSENVSPDWRVLNTMFTTALDLYRQYHWQAALQLWQEVASRFPSDGPTRFYIQYIQQHDDILQQLEKKLPEGEAYIKLADFES